MEHHHHHHHHEVTSLNRAFIIGIVINALYVVCEAVFGFIYNSLGLLSDAGHNLGDCTSLVLAMLAFKLSTRPATERYTYGYRKSTVLVSLLNALILLVAVGVIIGESVSKILHPVAVDGDVVAWVAGVGVLINGFTAWLFIDVKNRDLNVKGAYLHMAADALVSIGVVISGIVIHYTGFYLIDPIVGLVIAAVIVYSTFDLLRDSLRLALDGVPRDIDMSKIEKAIADTPDVIEFHHLHVWALSTTQNALTVHVRVRDYSDMESVKSEIKHRLDHLGISHATIELETASEPTTDSCGCCDTPHNHQHPDNN